jgi:maltooligosyltrehalose trehalohydrolase
MASSEPLRVWAPRAKRVDLVLFPSEERVHCRPAPGGWFVAERAVLEPEQKYAFSLDGGPPLPDPRSADQPEGVHGPSRRVDFERFSWSDAEYGPVPLERAVIYELHVGTFTEAGTFDGVLAELPRLRALGITHIELMPVASFPGERGWGYDGVSLFAPQASYGGPYGLMRLVDACHREGIGVIVDVVYNHLGPSGNYLGHFGPYFTGRYHTPWGDALNFDGPGSDEVRRFVLDNARFWLEKYHVDGLRLDAVQTIFDQSPEHLLATLSREVAEFARASGRPLFLIGECDLNAARFITERPRGYGLDAQWSDDFHYALHAALTGERAGYYQDFGPLRPLARALTQGYALQGEFSRYRQRGQGAPPGHQPGRRFVVYSQNHDQVGNRPRGDRLTALVSEAKCTIAAGLTLLSPFTPMLFMGEEWGAPSPFHYFIDHAEPELRDAVRSGRQREMSEFGWENPETLDPSSEDAFHRSKLNACLAETDAAKRTFERYRSLIALRRTHPELQSDELKKVRAEFDEDERWLVLWRGRVGLLCNFSERPVSLRLPAFRPLFGEENLQDRGGLTLLLPGLAVIEASRKKRSAKR